MRIYFLTCEKNNKSLLLRTKVLALGVWETIHNPNFKGVEFDPLLAEAGSNAFTMSPTKWGYSARNLGYMKSFAAEYPDFPFLQVPLAKLQEKPFLQARLANFTVSADGEFVQVPLAQITWYHLSTSDKVMEGQSTTVRPTAIGKSAQ